MGLKGTGTIRENGVRKACPLSRSTETRKKERGAIEFVSSDTNTISLCKWHDNSVVAIASNHTKILPTLPKCSVTLHPKNCFSNYHTL
nr:unnamed protein product [Callosobruchus analis]